MTVDNPFALVCVGSDSENRQSNKKDRTHHDRDEIIATWNSQKIAPKPRFPENPVSTTVLPEAIAPERANSRL
jgi:hypothetical protein